MPDEETAGAEPETDGETGLVDAFRERVIDLRGMAPPVRALTGLAMLVVIGCAVLLGIGHLPQPLVRADLAPAGELPKMPVAVLLGSCLFLIVAWSYLLTGALHSHLSLRIAGVALYAALVAAAVAALIESGAATDTLAVGLGAALLLACTVALTITVWAVDRVHEHGGRPERHHRHHLKLPTFLFLLVSTAALFALVASHGAGTGTLGAFVWLQLSTTQFLLLPVLYLAGTDFAEWAEVAAGAVSHLAAAADRPWSTWVVATASIGAGALLVEDAFLHGAGTGWDLIPELLLALLPLAAVAALGWFAISAANRAQVPIGAMALTAAAGYLAVVAPPILLGAFGHPWRPASALQAIGGPAPFLWIPVGATAAAVVVGGGGRVTAALFVAASAALFLSTSGLPYWLGVLIGQRPWIVPGNLYSVGAALGLGAVILIATLAATRRLRASLPLLRLVLALLLGVLGLQLLASVVFGTVFGAAERIPAAEALVLLVAIGWDVATSGGGITNRSGRHVPHHARVLLYLGYAMLVAVWVLYFGSFHGTSGEAAGMAASSSEDWPALGIEFMGLPLLLTVFIARLGSLRRRMEPAGEARASA